MYTLKLLIEQSFSRSCQVAYSGKEALDIIKNRLKEGERVHELILTDINMPEMDGMVMASKIMNMLEDSGSKINIFAVTAMNDDFIKENFYQFGIKEVL